MIDPVVFEEMKRLRGSKEPHDVCKLNGMMVMNAHLMLDEIIELRDRAGRVVARQVTSNIGAWEEVATGQEPGSLSKPSMEAPAAGLTVGAEPPTATGEHPQGVPDYGQVFEYREYEMSQQSPYDMNRLNELARDGWRVIHSQDKDKRMSGGGDRVLLLERRKTTGEHPQGVPEVSP